MKKLLKTIFGILSIILLIGVGFVFYLSQNTDLHEEIKIEEVAIESMPDGVYTGSFEESRWRNALEVTIHKGKLTNISTKKTVLFEKDEVSDEIFERVINEQKVAVDSVSGATITSKAYLKSIENALSPE